jgi:hypothetical protein
MIVPLAFSKKNALWPQRLYTNRELPSQALQGVGAGGAMLWLDADIISIRMYVFARFYPVDQQPTAAPALHDQAGSTEGDVLDAHQRG